MINLNAIVFIEGSDVATNFPTNIQIYSEFFPSHSFSLAALSAQNTLPPQKTTQPS
jgi:hypothetical protein